MQMWLVRPTAAEFSTEFVRNSVPFKYSHDVNHSEEFKNINKKKKCKGMTLAACI